VAGIEDEQAFRDRAKFRCERLEFCPAEYCAASFHDDTAGDWREPTGESSLESTRERDCVAAAGGFDFQRCGSDGQSHE
jgi:hypothetical protein